MDEPTCFAIVENDRVTNVIWIRPEQASDFGAVPITDPLAGIGWSYVDGQFIAPIEETTEGVPE